MDLNLKKEKKKPLNVTIDEGLSIALKQMQETMNVPMSFIVNHLLHLTLDREIKKMKLKEEKPKS